MKGKEFMKNYLLIVFLTLLTVVFAVGAVALELDTAEAATLQSTTFEGSGTADDPYIIADEDDFIAFSDAMAGGSKYNGKYFKQTADLDFEDSTDYNGITMSTNTMFYGIYDGDGHTINVKLSGEDLCIFSYVYGTIMNLGTTGSITNTLTSGTAYATGIARSIQANAKLINCYSTMSLKGGQVGGLSISMYGIANNCYFAGTVKGTTTSRAICVAVKTTSSFTNCYYTTGSVGNAVATSVTDDEAKTTLAESLNDGRESAATAAGVSVESIYRWTNQNGYPEHYVYVDPGITGTGTKADPYVIDSAADFVTFTNNINSGTNYSGKYIRQDADIDLSTVADYAGTNGDGTISFYGMYNGNGHTIKVNIDLSEKAVNNTVFPYVHGTIANLGITGSIKNGGSYSSGLARSTRAGSKLINCYSNAVISGKNVGGLTASNYGVIENCYFGGKITATASAYGIAQSTNGSGTYKNCYFVSGCGANTGDRSGNSTIIMVTADASTTTLAATLNSGRADAAEALELTKKEVSAWTNAKGLPTHYVPVYEEISVTQSKHYVAAVSTDVITFTTEADYVSDWDVDTGYSDAKYTVSEDKKTITVTPGHLAGVITVTPYSDEDEPLCEACTLIIHSGKAGVPGVNMLNGLAKEVDFENGYSYGIKDIKDKSLSVGDIPEIDYSASVNESGEVQETLENTSAKAVLADSSSCNKGDGWYYVFKTAVSGFETDRAYSVYAQIYTDSTTAYNAGGWFNNFKDTDAKGSMTITYDSRTNTWKEYKLTGTYTRNTTAPPEFNSKIEGFVYAEDGSLNPCTITVAAIDNVYIVPHYNIIYHMPDGTTETVSYNPVVNEYPLEISTEYVPVKSYEEGNYYNETTGKYNFYSGLWASSEDGAGYGKFNLENKDLHLYPEKLSEGSAIYKLDSLSSMTFEYSENVTVIDEYNSAVITNNGTKAITIEGKGYNATLNVVNEAGETVATIALTGNHKWRPGLNYFTGTKEGYDIETAALFDVTSSAYITDNPVKDSVNDSQRALKISSGTAMLNAKLQMKMPIEWDRPYRVDYDVMGNLNGSYWHMMNTTNANCILNTYASPNVSASSWKHVAVATDPLWKVDKGTHPYLNTFIIQGTGLAGDSSYALYIDNFSIIPAYKVQYVNAKGESIDVAFYNPMKADTEEVFLETTYTVDYNPNANYLVNGTPVETNGKYTLAYEDLKITVLPNDNAVMFSGNNATIVVPEGDTYILPYPHELEGFLADDFVIWKDENGNELEPGMTVNTADIIGNTIYAYCDASVYPRSPANGAVMNMAAIRHNNWLANYQPGNIARKADMGTISERGASFRWEAVPNAVSYKVYYSVNSNMSDSKYVSTSNTTVTAYHLLRATKYYWYVEAILSDNSTVCTDVWTFTTADVANTYRYLNNMRDLGGMVTEDGLYRIKQNMVIRSGVVDGNTAKIMEKFGFKAELDLRGVEANGRTVSPYGEDVNYILIEGTHYFGNSSSEKHYLNKTGQKRLKEEVQVFADKDNYPLNFHCAAGRDRTGVLAYIIEGLLGIPEDVIMMDYELSWLSGSAASQKNSATYFGWMVKFNEHINTFEGETFADRMAAFCVSIGVTEEEIASIKEILLEDNTMDVNVQTLDVASIRAKEPQGLRYACFVDSSVKSVAEECGFIVSTEKALAAAYPEDSAFEKLTFNSAGDKNGVLDDGKTPYLSAAAYVKGREDYSEFYTTEKASVIFPETALENIYANGYYYTVVLTHIKEEYYTDALVGRPYVKIDGKYYYGKAFPKSIYETALALKEKYEAAGADVPGYVSDVINSVEK